MLQTIMVQNRSEHNIFFIHKILQDAGLKAGVKGIKKKITIKLGIKD